MRAGLILALLAVAPSVLAAPDVAQAPPRGGPELVIPEARGDRALLEEIYAETKVGRRAAKPGLAAYLQELAQRLAEWIESRMRWAPQTAGVALSALLVLAFAVLAAAAGILLVRLFELVASRKRPPSSPERRFRVSTSEGSARQWRSAEAWRRRFEERLADGDRPGALVACWWWLAESILPGKVDPAWTSHELIRVAKRPDLRALVAALDALRFGRTRPQAGELRQFARRLEESAA